MLRIALLGCGRIGRMHAGNIAAHPRTTLAGVYDVASSASTGMAERRNLPVFAGGAAEAGVMPELGLELEGGQHVQILAAKRCAVHVNEIG